MNEITFKLNEQQVAGFMSVGATFAESETDIAGAVKTFVGLVTVGKNGSWIDGIFVEDLNSPKVHKVPDFNLWVAGSEQVKLGYANTKGLKGLDNDTIKSMWKRFTRNVSELHGITKPAKPTLAGKANLNGGNTFTGTQNVTKVVASDSIVSPIYQGSTAKVQIGNGEVKEIFRYTTGLYSSLILDAFLKIDEDPTQYAIQTVYIVVNPVNESEIFFTSITAVSSPSASGTPPDYENATFTPTTIIYSAELLAGNTIIRVDNQTGLGTINYKSIVRSFTTTG
jgi:hypothetical protein